MQLAVGREELSVVADQRACRIRTTDLATAMLIAGPHSCQ